MNTIEELSTVALTVDRPDLGLTAGEIGAVVAVLAADEYDVEFVDADGTTYGLHTLRRAELVRMKPGEPGA